MRVRCKSKFNSNKICNLFKVTKKISTFRLKKLEQITFLHVNLKSFFVFFSLFFSHFLALSEPFFSFLVCDNLVLSVSSLKSLLSIYYAFLYLYFYILNIRKTGCKHRIINNLINKFEIFFTNSKLHTFNFLILLHQRPLHY